MLPQSSFALAIGLAALWGAPVLASTVAQPTFDPRIVINDDAGADAARALGAPFESVVELRFLRSSDGQTGLCSGALISSTAILTAQHCLRDTTAGGMQVRFTEGDGTLQFSRSVDTISRMPGYSFLTDGTDLAILQLSQAVTDRQPFRLLGESILGETARMVGYGLNGIGSEGTLRTRDGARWAADNIIDQQSTGEGYSGLNALFRSDFDNPDGTSNTLSGSSPEMLELEGTTAGGDSGGPLLVDRGGEWVIAAVLSGGTTDTSVYGDISIWTGITSSEAQSFARSGGGTFWAPTAIIPLPPSGLLLLGALGLAGGALRRRRGGGGMAVAA